MSQRKSKSSSLPISFGDDNKDKNHTRGTQIANRNISESMFLTPQVQQKGFASDTTNDNTNKPLFGSSKYPTQIITLELDDAPVKQAPELILSVQAETTETELKTNIINNDYYNDISSYAVPNQTCSQVLNGLKDTLFDYSRDFDMEIIINHNYIQGMVFMNGYMDGIKFKINIWKQNDNISRFELLRTDGDAMATAKFLGDIQSKFFNKGNDNNEKQMNFVSLGFDDSGLDLNDLFDDTKMEMENIQEELNGINEALIRNDMCVIDELQYLYEKICESDSIYNDIIQHKELLKTIMNQTAKNIDIRVVRGCLVILQKLCNNEKISLVLCQQYGLITNLSKLLDNQHSIIKNYVVQILAQNTKYINEIGNVKNGLEKYQNEWGNSVLKGNGCINENMFNQIYKRLSEIM